MIVIVDYGLGNLRSVQKTLDRLGVQSKISSSLLDISTAEKLILPGVGHFANGVKNLHESGIWDVLNEQVLVHKTPILGICLGMQLFSKRSEEGGADGLGWLDAETVRFTVSDIRKFKIPHIGWNSLQIKKENPLFHDVAPNDLFYFVHSYHFVCHNQENILSSTVYDYSFTSAVQKNNIYGTQFHPEKSHKSGLKILKNFVERIDYVQTKSRSMSFAER